MTTQAMVEREGTVLLGWMGLLGWTVEIERDGSGWIGLAKRADGVSGDLCIGGSANSQRELVSKLFNRAVRGLALQAA
jgi:hypothetical protein